MKAKALLYCTKAKPYLYRKDDDCFELLNKLKNEDTSDYKKYYGLNNGKIVAECDFEVEKINVLDCTFRTFNLVEKEILNKSCLTYKELFEYLKNRDNPRGYAIHIKNLHIFDKPKELSNYYTKNLYKDINKTFTDEVMIDGEWYRPVDKAPQNMMRVKRVLQEDGILISIQPQWLCKILNGEKTIEVRKEVLKGMLK